MDSTVATTPDVDVEFTPPYISFSTVKNKLDEWNEDDLPHQIDRSVLVGMSGSNQQGFLSAVQAFGFVDSHMRPTDRLRKYAAGDKDSKVTIWREIVAERYGHQMEVSERNGTAAQLRSTFTDDPPAGHGLAGETARKAETFFLHMAKAAEIELSTHFKATRTTRRRKKGNDTAATKSAKTGGADSKDDDSTDSSGDGTMATVNLESGGTVTLILDVNLFKLSAEDRDFVLSLIDQVQAHDSQIDYGDEEDE